MPRAETGATVDIHQDGDVLLLTATIDGVTRELTTGGLTFGGDFTRFGWRFDDPCLPQVIAAVGASPAVTG